MLTENTYPCFAVLRSITQILNKYLYNACQEIDECLCRSSYLYVHNAAADLRESNSYIATTTKGPSIERLDPYMDKCQSGTNAVISIHC